jgi:hypothetical protein
MDFTFLSSWIPAFARNDDKEPRLFNARHSGEPRIESGAGTGVQFKVFEKKVPSTNEAWTMLDSLLTLGTGGKGDS